MTNEFLDEFNRLRHHVASALEHNSDTQSIEDVIDGLLKNDFQMWTAQDAILITEICKMPRKTFMNIALGGGDSDQIKSLVSAVEREAERMALAGVMILGRRGWSRVLPGYREVATLHIKEF